MKWIQGGHALESESEASPEALKLALFFAVLHHGMANWSSQAKPADRRTVMHTAMEFNYLLEQGELPDR